MCGGLSNLNQMTNRLPFTYGKSKYIISSYNAAATTDAYYTYTVDYSIQLLNI